MALKEVYLFEVYLKEAALKTCPLPQNIMEAVPSKKRTGETWKGGEGDAVR